MSGKRCQVCEGPIANGRCRLCGMPYRNDEVLYHLNERRSDHYRHASEKARAAMRQQQIPLGDRKPEVKKTESREEIKARQQKEREAAVQRMKNTRVPTANKQTQNKASSQRVMKNVDIRGQRKPYTSVTMKSDTKKKKSSLLGIFAIVIALLGIVPGIIENVGERIFINEIHNETTIAEPVEERLSLSRWQDGADIIYEAAADSGLITVGEDMEAGEYIAYVTAGSAEFYVTPEGGEYISYHLEDEEDVIYLVLNEGDLLNITHADGVNGTVCFYTQEE